MTIVWIFLESIGLKKTSLYYNVCSSESSIGKNHIWLCYITGISAEKYCMTGVLTLGFVM